LSIHDDFDYYIYDCGSDNMVFCNYVDYGSQRTDDIKLEMPKSPDLIYYFGVRFPNRMSFILNTLGLAILFSALLLLAIAFFGYAMFVILKQKRDSELQTDFINNMTHEFKTPISTIKISSDVFLNDPKIQGDPRLAQYAEIIQEQNNRLSAHVDKVLSVARIENDGLEMKMERVDLVQTIERAIQEVNPKINQKKGVIDWGSMKNAKAVIDADRFHIEHLLINILDNAVKYSRTTPRIEIQLNETTKHYKLKISDNGIGIPKDKMDSLFDKFYRVSTGNVHDVKGFGLGLYYVKYIADQHGWGIKVESTVGKGTDVSFIIPKLQNQI